jgi:hypothetical protein
MTNSDSDQEILDRWWHAFVTERSLPEELALVQGRLIRSVHTGMLPSGQVHVKTMAFPRAKDRLRYAFRSLPATHEANMLAMSKHAGIPCPDVVEVRTMRRWGLPYRSLLVLRTLEASVDEEDEFQRVSDEILLATRLLAAGIHHRDLHSENFLRQKSGEMAVLDMQSVSKLRPGLGSSELIRFSVASRLLRDRAEKGRQSAVGIMREQGLLKTQGEVAEVMRRAGTAARHYAESRVRRCLTNSTEFERHIRATGVEYRVRGALPEGRWWSGDPNLRDAWMGQRINQLQHGVAPVFAAFFQKWWWLGGGCALYVSADHSNDIVASAVQRASRAVRKANG